MSAGLGFEPFKFAGTGASDFTAKPTISGMRPCSPPMELNARSSFSTKFLPMSMSTLCSEGLTSPRMKKHWLNSSAARIAGESATLNGDSLDFQPPRHETALAWIISVEKFWNAEYGAKTDIISKRCLFQ